MIRISAIAALLLAVLIGLLALTQQTTRRWADIHFQIGYIQATFDHMHREAVQMNSDLDQMNSNLEQRIAVTDQIHRMK